MRLTDREFMAMNNPFRQALQRHVEYPIFRRMGLVSEQQDILEIGCGSGYGAVLLSRLRPRSYTGIDLMPEQIELARRRGLSFAQFHVQDAAQLEFLGDASQDVVVIFGVLHHIPNWREVIRETHRVLRPGGHLYVEEPDGGLLAGWDRVFRWDHPGAFCLADFEQHLTNLEFTVCARKKLLGFGWYCAQR